MSINKQIRAYILGYGGLAKEIGYLISQADVNGTYYSFSGFVTHRYEDKGKIFSGYEIVHEDDVLRIHDKTALFLGTGSPVANNNIYNKLSIKSNLLFPSFISRNSHGCWTRCHFDEGNIVTDGCSFTVDIDVGKFNLFNLNCTVGHDAVIGSFNIFNPSCNLSGNIHLGSRILVGTGAQILQGLSICDDVVIGAGAVVTKDIIEAGTYVGTPAKRV